MLIRQRPAGSSAAALTTSIVEARTRDAPLVGHSIDRPQRSRSARATRKQSLTDASPEVVLCDHRGVGVWDRGELRYVRDSRGDERPYWSGQSWQLGTARFWEETCRQASVSGHYRLGENLRDEILACVLGGYGVRWSAVSPYIERIRESGALARDVVAIDELRLLLTEPVLIDGRWQRYRFPNQRARRLSSALNAVCEREYSKLGDLELRDALMLIEGIGPKTASWVVRNHRASDRVAIIDIHIARAGIVAGVFDPAWDVNRHYLDFEAAFLSWSQSVGLSAAALDSVIWGYLAGDEAWAKDVLGVDSYSNVALRPVWPPEMAPGNVQS
ncbi:Thermostable 8-oxoguanine DNA glycosylase [Microbacterium sp. RURRCA19A]|nr:Thermostable 8-oxoguanine DNA glycosylase [Microbacterium sp. RURRCA19A]